MAETRSFLGTGWGFPPEFVRQFPAVGSPRGNKGCASPGGVRMVSDADDIRESLVILFSTTLGERVMQPDFGASLQEQLFEPMNASTLTFIEDMLRTAIIYHEPRIETEGLSIKIDPLEDREGGLNIEINARIRGTNSRFNFVYPFYRAETGQQP